MNSKLNFALAALLALFVLNASVAEAVPFANGSFETNAGGNPSIATGNFVTGSDGWQAVGAGARIYDSIVGPPTDGSDHLALNLSNNPGGIRQAFDTVTGGLYQVLFDYAAISNGSSLDYDLSYEIVGITTPVTVTATTAGANFNTAYTTDEEILFAATGPTSTIQILSLTGGSSSYGPIIDNVRLQFLGLPPVPEPASSAMLGMGGLMLLGLTRRRRRAVQENASV